MAEADPATIRAFVALDLDPPSLRRVSRTADRLKMGSGAPSATWTPPARMHLTLKFMAALPVELVAPLEAALRPVTATSALGAYGIRLDAFPSVRAATIVVASLLDTEGTLRDLAAAVERAAQGLGMPRERRAFRPHVTLARLKRAYDAHRWLRPDLADGAGPCSLNRLTLYRSHLEADGPTYVPLARFDLPGA